MRARAAAGHLPVTPAGTIMTGKVGSELSTEQAAEAARAVGLNICATLKAELGSLDRVKRFVKLTAFVNCVGPIIKQKQSFRHLAVRYVWLPN